MAVLRQNALQLCTPSPPAQMQSLGCRQWQQRRISGCRQRQEGALSTAPTCCFQRTIYEAAHEFAHALSTALPVLSNIRALQPLIEQHHLQLSGTPIHALLIKQSGIVRGAGNISCKRNIRRHHHNCIDGPINRAAVVPGPAREWVGRGALGRIAGRQCIRNGALETSMR